MEELKQKNVSMDRIEKNGKTEVLIKRLEIDFIRISSITGPQKKWRPEAGNRRPVKPEPFLITFQRMQSATLFVKRVFQEDFFPLTPIQNSTSFIIKPLEEEAP
jgi:hypothetical protein